jgi:carboxymethylenebutenolidase
MTDVTIKTPTHQLRGYLARPVSEGPWPGVIVLHDAAGMTDDLRHQADWLAGAGYLAVAPDLFSWGRKMACLRATFRDVQAGRGQAFTDIEATRQWLAGQAGCSGRIGVIGFCLGGAFSMLLAPGGAYEASSVNYGVTAYTQAALRGACPIVGSFGGKDRNLRGAAQKLDQALETLGIDHDVKEYQDAGHDFINDHRGEGFWGALYVVLGHLPVIAGYVGGYHEPSARDACRRILSFFDRHLKSGS